MRAFDRFAAGSPIECGEEPGLLSRPTGVQNRRGADESGAREHQKRGRAMDLALAHPLCCDIGMLDRV